MKDPYRYFRIEARELVDQLSSALLELERTGEGTLERVNQMFRWAHTLKGAARVVRRADIAEVAHRLEDRLEPLRRQGLKPTRPLLDEMLAQVDEVHRLLRNLDAPPPLQAQPASQPPPRPTDAPPPVRVEVAELDELLVGLSELRAHLDRLEHAAAKLSDRAEGVATAVGVRHHALRSTPEQDPLVREFRGLSRELTPSIDQAHSALNELIARAQELRLVPVDQLFSHLERAVQLEARNQGKQVRFEVRGGHTRVDSQVLTALKEGLTHMVRNAVIHGLETAEERLSAGKPAEGRVELEVVRRGSSAVFRCRDDGRGLNLEAIRVGAVKARVIEAERSLELAEAEVARLIFRPGVSSATALTEEAGRGVGLDVVRSMAETLRGQVRVESQLEQGTLFEVRVPLSLSSLHALVVEVQGTAVAFPLDSVPRTYRLPNRAMAHAETLLHEEWALPMCALATLLGFPSPGEPQAAVVVQSGDPSVAVAVDRVVKAEELVLRPVPWTCGDVGVIGASFDNQGTPLPVLDPRRVVEMARVPKTRPGPNKERARPAVLVIDDSLTTRILEQSILESAGYEVDVAASAEEALALAEQRGYGLFLVDVEMPGMNGIEFVGHTRQHPKFKEVPAIIVSSRGASEDVRRGAEAGASAYIVKGEFDQRRFLDTVRRIIG